MKISCHRLYEHVDASVNRYLWFSGILSEFRCLGLAASVVGEGKAFVKQIVFERFGCGAKLADLFRVECGFQGYECDGDRC